MANRRRDTMDTCELLLGSYTSNRGHEHHWATRALTALEGRPRHLGGFQGGGGTRKDKSSLTVQV